MEFKIRHQTPLFFFGIIFPLVLLVAALLLAVALGITIQNETAAMIGIGLIVFSAAAEILFIILYVTEVIFGAKIIIWTDHVELRMLLRRKKLYFYDIEQAKYSHFETGRNAYGREDLYYETSNYSHTRDFLYHKMRKRHDVSAMLEFYLTSGKVVTLTDDARSYARKREHAKVDLSLDPDADVKLYQAYQCYCSARDKYALAQRERLNEQGDRI